MDGRVDMKDVELLRGMLSGGPRNPLQKILGDVDCDGQMRWSDYIKLSKELYYVDVNQNGIYTEEDINDVLYHIAGMDTLSIILCKSVEFRC